MATLSSSSWTELNSYTVNDPNFQGRFILYAIISETDIPGNRTKVTYHWDFNLTYGWQTSYYAQDYVSGAGWNKETYRSYSSSGTLRSGSEWINHADDGRGSGTCYGRTRMGGMGFDTDWVTGTFDLPTIARASKPTINTEKTSDNTFTLGDTITVYTNRKFSDAKHTIKFVYPTLVNGATVQKEVLLGTEKGVETSITYNTLQVSQQMMSSYPNLATIQGTVQCMTYNGSGTQIGSTETISWSASIPDDIKPTITLPSDVIAEETAANGGLKGKSVADKTVVRYISKKKVKATVTGMYGATISRVYVTDGVGVWNMTLSSGSYTATFNNIQSKTLTIVAIDSRGKESRTDISGLTYIPYEKPTLRQAAFIRSNASTGEHSLLLAAGTLYRDKVIGNVNPNTITVKYVKGSASQQTVPTSGIEYSGSSWSTNDSVDIGTLNPREQYTGSVTITDSFGQTVSFDIILSSVQNSLWVGKNTVRVHDYLIADGDIAIQGLDSAIGMESIFDILAKGDGGKNLLPSFIRGAVGKNFSQDGITFYRNYDGSISYTGTPTKETSVYTQWFMWDKEDTCAIFSCDTRLDSDGSQIASDGHTWSMIVLQGDAGSTSDSAVNPTNAKRWDGTTDMSWIHGGTDEEQVLLRKNKVYQVQIIFEITGSTSQSTSLYPMIRDAHICSSKYQQNVPHIKTLVYSPGGSIYCFGIQIGRLAIVVGKCTGGSSVPYGITFDDIPYVVAGPATYSNADFKPDVRLGPTRKDTFWLDTNYGSNTKYWCSWIAVGPYSGNDFRR